MKFELKSKFNNFIYLLLTLLFVCTAVNVGLNFADSGDSDLSNIAVAADQPTNKNYYWTDTEAQTEQGVDFTSYTLSGSGSGEDPYLIQSKTDLAFLSWTIYTGNAYNNHVSGNYYYSDIYFKQTKNLDLSAYYWQPIGIGYTRDGTSASRYFSGNYNGGGHTVSGVFTPAGSSNGYSYQGLFGYVAGRSLTLQASIANFGVIDSFVQGDNDVGGVVGYAYSNATISNVYNTGSVSGSSYVGGVVGYAQSATITNCYNTGSVSASGEYYSYVGGVVGTASSTTITNCYNTGTVSGEDGVGGVVGSAHSNTTISNAYNTGTVSGEDGVGGVGGMIPATITNCYNTGSVSGNKEVGGVAGRAYNGTITNCYNTGSVSGMTSIGGIAGYGGCGGTSNIKNAPITNCYNTGSVSGMTSIGGIAGYSGCSSTGYGYRAPITNCYNTGSVEGTGESVGGVVGQAASGADITNTYYGGDCTLNKGIGSGSGRAIKIDAPVEEWAKNEEWYFDSDNWDGAYSWDFDLTWYIDSEQNSGYPVLFTEDNRPYYWIDESAQNILGVDFDNYSLAQDTSASTTTYLIQSETDLAFLSWTIYNNKAYNNHVFNGRYFYSGITFKQTRNLDLSAYYWQPIGIFYTRDGATAKRYFSGNYDGDSHTVSGVYTPVGYSYQGLFGYVLGRSSTQQANISNLGVIDSFIRGYQYVGGVVGEARYATVSNAYNTGSVSGTGDYVGGVVGDTSYLTISNVYNTGSVSGSSNVGGVVGYAYDNTRVINVYNTGSVNGNSDVGGVVGEADSAIVSNCYNTGSVEALVRFSETGDAVGGVVGRADDATITNCFNTSSVSGDNWVGGVVGRANGATITNCYNTGSVSGSGSYKGGVAGYSYRSSSGSTTITSTYYGGDCTLNKGIGYGSGSATKIDAPVDEWAKNEEWYLDSSNWDSSYSWDFKTVWEIGDGVPNYVGGGGYPYLQSLGMTKHEIIYWTDEAAQEALGVDFDNYTLAEDTSASITTYLIQSETDLAFLSWTIYNNKPFNNYVNIFYFYQGVTFRQTKDLDLSDYYWQPIGLAYTREGVATRRYFSGNYDGGGHTVSGVYTPAGSGNGYYYQGLFGYVNSQSLTNRIANVGLIDSFIQGDSYVSGIAGYINYNATITNCFNTSSVSGHSYVGGVVGQAYSDSTISNCFNTGFVEGTEYVGGIAGYAYNSVTIINCYTTGIVSGGNSVGGICGQIQTSTIQNCLNFGNVSGNSNVGGIVGSASSSIMTNCGVEGAVISGSSDVGIFVGRITNSSTTIQNCYAIVDEALSPYGSNSGTVTNCLWIAGGVKYYLGTDFSGFAWLNTDSCPIPKGLSWMGQFWTEDITSQITSSSDWTEWVA